MFSVRAAAGQDRCVRSDFEPNGSRRFCSSDPRSCRTASGMLIGITEQVFILCGGREASSLGMLGLSLTPSLPWGGREELEDVLLNNPNPF